MFKLTGIVQNNTKGVLIEVQGPSENIEKFIGSLCSENPDVEYPPMLEVSACEVHSIEMIPDENDFSILASNSRGIATTHVSQDMATCDRCLRELNDITDFRYAYPFINCTNCGPRYSIVKTIPYDRPNTTMSTFEMCPRCQSQYEDPADRRFHAQPVACPMCGPKIWLADGTGNVIVDDDSQIVVASAARMLLDGKILAIKGIGGFHLAVDAFNDDAVKRLRQRKRRDHKPFAMMTAGTEVIEHYGHLDDTARATISDARCPIVLLPRKHPTDAPSHKSIAPAVAQATGSLGFMLPYAPLHHMLFARDGIELLVMTSANLSDEPLICDNDEALEKLSDIADAFLFHNRDIYRRVDDSILHIIDGEPALLRRSRGYVPEPILSSSASSDDIFAAGADLKNTFCLARDNQFVVSEHIGDMADAGVYRHYLRSVPHLQQLFESTPTVVACDLHPGYLSTRYAESLSIHRTIKIQHHWAHIASVIAEHDYNGSVIGIAADGTGLGADGAIWGCECLLASLESFERLGHLACYPLPGGDSAAKEPIRPLLGMLSTIPGADRPDTHRQLLLMLEPDAARLDTIAEQLKRNLNTARTSSLGRFFDVVAALCSLGAYNNFEAQLPMALESIAADDCDHAYDFDINSDPEGGLILDFASILGQVIDDIANTVDTGTISAKFHNCLAAAFLRWSILAHRKTGITTVALSGGVFCNRYLANRTTRLLKQNGFSVLLNRKVPANDGGISLGQAAIAADAVRRGEL
jgi:hydrogenase maturation protein HypF